MIYNTCIFAGIAIYGYSDHTMDITIEFTLKNSSRWYITLAYLLVLPYMVTPITGLSPKSHYTLQGTPCGLHEKWERLGRTGGGVPVESLGLLGLQWDSLGICGGVWDTGFKHTRRIWLICRIALPSTASWKAYGQCRTHVLGPTTSRIITIRALWGRCPNYLPLGWRLQSSKLIAALSLVALVPYWPEDPPPVPNLTQEASKIGDLDIMPS